MYVHAPYMCLVSAESWKGITLPGTGVITVVGHHVCAGNGTQNPVFSASELLSRPDLFLFVRQSPPRCIPNLCHQTCAMRPVHLHYFVFKILFSGDRILPCSSDCPQICDNLPDSCSQCWNTFLSYHTQLHWPLCCLFVSLYVCVCPVLRPEVNLGCYFSAQVTFLFVVSYWTGACTRMTVLWTLHTQDGTHTHHTIK